MIYRDEAYNLLQKYIKNEKLIKHSIAVEAIMKKIAYFLQEDINMWSLVGLLHDIDYEYTINNPESHATVSAQILEGLIPDNCINAIKSHNYIHTKYIPITSIDKSLIASDAVSGLIISSALVMPSKKINEVKLSTLTKKYKDKTFAKGCDRRRIELCIDLGIDLNDFLLKSLDALKEISNELNL